MENNIDEAAQAAEMTAETGGAQNPATDTVTEAAEAVISAPAGQAAEAQGPKQESREAEFPAELTEQEKQLIRNYALNDGEVRRVIISDYINRLKNADPVPAVMQGDAGSSPYLAPRAARDMREAAILAEALMKRR